MKCTKVSLIATLALAGLIWVAPTATAQDANSDKKPAVGQRQPPGRPGERLAKELNLSEEQNKKVQAVMAEQREKGTKIREDASLSQEQKREKGQALRTETQKKFKEILTPEQFQKWEKMRSEMRPGRPGGPDGKGAKKAEEK